MIAEGAPPRRAHRRCRPRLRHRAAGRMRRVNACRWARCSSSPRRTSRSPSPWPEATPRPPSPPETRSSSRRTKVTPQLSCATARIVTDALTSAGLPHGVFSLIESRHDAIAALRDDRVRAAAFTCSTTAGRTPADIAAGRLVPIPFYGELGSVNPVFVTEAALRENPRRHRRRLCRQRRRIVRTVVHETRIPVRAIPQAARGYRDRRRGQDR